MKLPQRLPLPQMQVNWAQAIDPVLNNVLLQGNLVQAALINGVNVIDHKLGRKQIGWILTDQDAAANIYRSQPLSAINLTLTSDAVCNVSLWCF